MIKYTKGNLLEAPVQALVNTVNTVGVMGKGIALQFKEAFPANFKAYRKACKEGWLHPGKLLVIREETIQGKKIIINFPTKVEWFKKSSYEYIESGLKELVKVIESEEIRSIAIPPLGCGNGGLRWDKVRALMEQYLAPLTNIEIIIYEPSDKVKEILKKQESTKNVRLTPARAMLLYAMFYYETMDETSSLFVANKLAYFLQRLGEKSYKRLKFEAGHYGPYSVQVEHMLYDLNKKYLKGLEQMKAKAFEPLELQYDRLKEVEIYINEELTSEQKSRLKSLITLIDGFQSALSLEALASVDYVLRQKPGIHHDDVLPIIQNWSERKRKLIQDKHVQIALQHLHSNKSQLELF
jgi:O-acetyl-ADP-ribose deacetylase (regulator of RNase III)